MTKAKPFDISKREVWEAFKKVKANQGAAGVDGQSIGEFEANLADNLYKLWNRLSSGSYLPPPVRRVDIPKAKGGTRPLGIPTVTDRIAQEVVRRYLEPLLEPRFHADSYGYRSGRSAIDAIRTARQRCWRADWVVDLDIQGFLDPASYCPLVHEAHANSSPCRTITLMRSPFCRPRITWTASSSPRLTRCNTVCRETPRARIASRIGRKPAAASALKRAFSSSVRRMRQGAPGVICSPAMKPALSRRWIVDGATPSAKAARLMVMSSPSAASPFGTKHGILQ